MSERINPWFTQLGDESEWDHALTGFFPSGTQDACLVWPKKQQYSSRRLTLGIINSDGPDRSIQQGTGTTAERIAWNAQWKKRYETLEVVPKVFPPVFAAANTNATIAGTITLNIRLADIFVINDSTLSDTTKPYQITVTNLDNGAMVGRSVVLKAYLMEGIKLKFGNNIILDTSAGSDFDPGTYCITFANTDITNTGTNGSPIQVVSLWKCPGYTNS